MNNFKKLNISDMRLVFDGYVKYMVLRPYLDSLSFDLVRQHVSQSQLQVVIEAKQKDLDIINSLNNAPRPSIVLSANTARLIEALHDDSNFPYTASTPYQVDHSQKNITNDDFVDLATKILWSTSCGTFCAMKIHPFGAPIMTDKDILETVVALRFQSPVLTYQSYVVKGAEQVRVSINGDNYLFGLNYGTLRVCKIDEFCPFPVVFRRMKYYTAQYNGSMEEIIQLPKYCCGKINYKKHTIDGIDLLGVMLHYGIHMKVLTLQSSYLINTYGKNTIVPEFITGAVPAFKRCKTIICYDDGTVELKIQDTPQYSLRVENARNKLYNTISPVVYARGYDNVLLQCRQFLDSVSTSDEIMNTPQISLTDPAKAMRDMFNCGLIYYNGRLHKKHEKFLHDYRKFVIDIECTTNF